MKKIFIILAILLSVPSFSDDSFNIGISAIYMTKIKNNEYQFTFSVTAPELALDLAEGTQCLVPNENFRITGNVKTSGLRERDILFARTDIDLNGDGDFEDVFITKGSGSTLIIDGRISCPATGATIYRGYRATRYLDSTGAPRFCRISSRGTPFLVHAYNDRSGIITMAFGSPSNQISMLALPNPHVRVSVISITESIKSAPVHTIAGEKTRYMFSNEQLFDDQAGNWANILWCAKPVQAGQSVFNMTLRGISPPFIISIEPYISLEKGILLRGGEKRKLVLQ